VKGRETVFFVKDEVKFSDHFESLADKIEEGGILFSVMLQNYDQADDIILKLEKIENEADAITHGIYKKLYKTFLAPLDREDIFALANKMDSIIDMIEAAAVRMKLYMISEPNAEIRELAVILGNSISLVKTIVYDMRQRKGHTEEILGNCAKINELENEGDRVLRQSMNQLFEREKDAIEIVKWKEVLERIEEATDVCEDVSNIVEGIILKYG
jgi:uncharacterized protein